MGRLADIVKKFVAVVRPHRDANLPGAAAFRRSCSSRKALIEGPSGKGRRHRIAPLSRACLRSG